MKQFLKTFLYTFLFVTLLLGGAGLYAWKRATGFLDAPIATEGGKKRVTIEKGATFKQIAANLEAEGIVRDRLVFDLYGRFIGAGTNIKAGNYELDLAWTPRALLEKLQSGGLVPQIKVTIPEGFNRWQIADLLSEVKLVDRAKFLDKVEREDLEGHLFPDTYWIKVGAPLAEVVGVLTQRGEAVFEELVRGAPEENALRQDADARRRLFILASLVEKEAQSEKDRGLIARVFYNRLAKGMKLETDPTCVYSAVNYKEVPHPRFCKDKDNPYSTYMIPALPPTAIANPGRASLDAALRPTTTGNAASLLYFVAKRDGTGEHYFSSTWEEHDAAVDRYLRGKP
jgi:UPF0755 protein